MWTSYRADTRRFAWLSLVLTPFALLLFVGLVSFASTFILHWTPDSGRSFFGGLSASYAFFIIAAWLNPKGHVRAAPWRSIVVPLFLIALPLYLAFGAGWADNASQLLTVIYIVSVIPLLWCLSAGYAPKSDYELYWNNARVPISDPLSFRNEIDRAHFLLGFLLAISELVLMSYAEIFSAKIYDEPPAKSVAEEAIRILRLLQNERLSATEILRRLSTTEARFRKAAGLLLTLRLLIVESEKLSIAYKGRQYLEGEIP